MQTYNVDFFGGPRDGDEVYQSVEPIPDYYVPITVNMIAPEILNSPVTESLAHFEGTEVHHYELERVNRATYVYKYRGVCAFPG